MAEHNTAISPLLCYILINILNNIYKLQIICLLKMVAGDKDHVNLPWVEKYRPNALEDLISHEDIISTIR